MNTQYMVRWSFKRILMTDLYTLTSQLKQYGVQTYYTREFIVLTGGGVIGYAKISSSKKETFQKMKELVETSCNSENVELFAYIVDEFLKLHTCCKNCKQIAEAIQYALESPHMFHNIELTLAVTVDSNNPKSGDLLAVLIEHLGYPELLRPM